MDFTLPASVQHKVDVQLATGRFARAEDVLNEALDFYAEHQATLGDLQASLDDIRAGCVRPLKEVADEIRMKHGWTFIVETYRVVVTDRASRQPNDIADWVAERAPVTAERWFNFAVEEISTLNSLPRRFGLARESPSLPIALREMLLGTDRVWRVLFTIRDRDVIVMCIRHAAQSQLIVDDLTG